MPRAEQGPGGPGSADASGLGDHGWPPAGPADLAEAVRVACAMREIDPAGAQLIHHYSNAVYYLPRARIVARVTHGADAGPRLVKACRVAQWLAGRHQFPATAPAPDVEPVHISPDVTVTYWRYYPQPAGAAPTSAHLGQLLRTLHQITESPPIQLDTWVPLAALETALLEHSNATRPLGTDERDWLGDEVRRLREDIGHLDWPLGCGLIHGDAWAGNLLWDVESGLDSAVLTDWDWVSYGPREIDLVPTWHAAARNGLDRGVCRPVRVRPGGVARIHDADADAGPRPDHRPATPSRRQRAP